jgi:cadmium resistance protein CadD (predicted permease)
VTASVVAEAVALFAVTNIDDLVVLSLFFAQGAGQRDSAARVVAGQYLGFIAILAIAIAAGLGASFLPEAVIPYFGLIPLALGLRAAWNVWRDRQRDDGGTVTLAKPGGPRVAEIASVTFANGGDNIGVYVPVFAAVGASGTIVYATVFLVLVGVWCVAGWFVATRPVIAKALSRWGHILLPLVLITIGLLILVRGGAFGL